MANKPAAIATTNTTPGSCVDVPCSLTKKVVYRFKTTTSSNVKMPYAVAINGKVIEGFKESALAIKCDGKSEIKLSAKTGDKVALYLNSDASPDFRKSAMYAVTVGEHDLVITITEKTARHADADTPVLKETKTEKNAKTGAEHKTEHYAAPLTGDIWLKISHKYTVDEAKAHIPATTAKEISEAVLHFYDGTLTAAKPNLTASLPASTGQSAMTITLKVGGGADTNCVANIQSFELFRDGLPRVHPKGFVALLEAARDAGVSEITLSSTWRPMVGSIAHRAGLGLDVNWLDAVQLNRQELRGAKPTPAADPNVSEEEKRLFKEKAAAEKAAAEAEAKLKALKIESDKIKGKNPLREQELIKEIPEAKTAAEDAAKATKNAEKAWNDERDKNEPGKVKNYRASLARCPCVEQLFDPWYMDDKTQDSTAATPNQQRPDPKGKGPSNEELHAHHLHITVHEPKIRKG